MTTPERSNDEVRLKRLVEASEWLLCMQDPKRTDEQMNDWLRWCDADPQNFAEFERLQRDWIDLSALKDNELSLTPGQKRALLAQENGHLATQYSTRRSTARRGMWAVAAGMAALTLALAAIHLTRAPPPAPAPQIATALSSRAATLPDGSRMILGAQSRVEMDFNGPKRQLDLSRGEAYFKVEHDKARPFVVHAGEVSVTAIGTAFDVRREEDKITVTVEEGTVEVSSVPGGMPPVMWRADAGYQLTYAMRDRTASLARVDPDAELAWRNDELAYVREPLGTVVENLNRYSTRKIVIEDPEVAAMPFTGTAFPAFLDDWVAGVEQAYPITARRTSGGDVVLSSRE
jgi:transmembrane sensor